jgi:hypothetical protein
MKRHTTAKIGTAMKTRRIQTLEGLPVYDAKEPLWIEVIKEDVVPKRRKDPERCALAAACTRTLHVEARAYLSRLYIKQPDGNSWLRYILPEVVRQEVSAFDRGGGFSQGTYRVTPLSPRARSGGPSQGGSGKRSTGTAPKRPSHRTVHGVRAPSPLIGGAIEK